VSVARVSGWRLCVGVWVPQQEPSVVNHTVAPSPPSPTIHSPLAHTLSPSKPLNTPNHRSRMTAMTPLQSGLTWTGGSGTPRPDVGAPPCSPAPSPTTPPPSAFISARGAQTQSTPAFRRQSGQQSSTSATRRLSSAAESRRQPRQRSGQSCSSKCATRWLVTASSSPQSGRSSSSCAPGRRPLCARGGGSKRGSARWGSTPARTACSPP